ncbi:MAG: hypothetical protein P4L63_02805 [Candidatus Pacebacteria bacterium]|nr:hypothetical protein [Candidatus Paceibacterota bacterium]
MKQEQPPSIKGVQERIAKFDKEHPDMVPIKTENSKPEETTPAKKKSGWKEKFFKKEEGREFKMAPEGVVERYDGDGNLTSKIIPGGVMEFYENGILRKMTFPNGTAEEFDEQGKKVETTAETKKTINTTKVEKEVGDMPEKEKLGLWKTLNTVGFSVEENKNKFFANIFGKIVKERESSREKNEEQGTLERFFRQMQNDHKLSAEEAKRKKEAVIKGEGEWKTKTFRGAQNTGFLVKDLFRYGRMVTDFTGYTAASSMRYWMMVSMAINSLSKAAKETRFANTKLINQTRIEDANKAAEEAWRIYEKAGGEFEEDGHSKGISNKALKDAYLKEMPKNLQERLKNPSTANKFVENIISGAIEKGVGALQKHIEKIENDPKLSDEQKKQKETSALKFFEAELVDYDRMITQVGTVDQLALWAHVTQKISKGVVYVTTAQTIIMSVEKLFGGISQILSNHHSVNNLSNNNLEAKNAFLKEIQNNKPNMEVEHPAVDAHIDEKKLQTWDVTHHAPEAGAAAPSLNEHLDKINGDAIVHHGEGIENTFIRQIEHDPKLAHDLGFTGKPEELHAWAQAHAHLLATKEGYVDAHGNEIRVAEADKVAYELKAENGHAVINERMVSDGSSIEIHHEGDAFEIGDHVQKYEYEYSGGHHGVAHTALEHRAPHPLTPEEAAKPLDTASLDSHSTNTEVFTSKNPKVELLKQKILEGSQPSQTHATTTIETSGRSYGAGGGGSSTMHDPHGAIDNSRIYDAHEALTTRGGPVRGPGFGAGGGSGYGGGAQGGYGSSGGMGMGYEDIIEYHHVLFPGASAADGEYLMRHLDLIGKKDIYHLGYENLKKICEVSYKNMEILFGTDSGIMSDSLGGMKASAILDHAKGTDHLIKYFDQLRAASGLKPEKGIFGIGGENAKHYMGRALEKIMAEGRLDKFEESLQK